MHLMYEWWNAVVSSQIPKWQLSKILSCPMSLIGSVSLLQCILYGTSLAHKVSECFHATDVWTRTRTAIQPTHWLAAEWICRPKNILLRFRLAILFTACRDTKMLKLCLWRAKYNSSKIARYSGSTNSVHDAWSWPCMAPHTNLKNKAKRISRCWLCWHLWGSASELQETFSHCTLSLLSSDPLSVCEITWCGCELE